MWHKIIIIITLILSLLFLLFINFIKSGFKELIPANKSSYIRI